MKNPSVVPMKEENNKKVALSSKTLYLDDKLLEIKSVEVKDNIYQLMCEPICKDSLNG